jgi:Fur family ferric uptake transcriptional regulator
MPRGESGSPPGRASSEHRSASDTDAWIATFHARLKERGLKSTAQRDDIARVFYRHGRHVSAEELFVEVRKVSPHVGYATIYRTLKLLRECELVYERHFNDGQARYETVGERHHDHFICDRCGRIIEFENMRIERLQEIVARELGALLIRHKMELYGLCASCRPDAS